jgi:hypothetical protein
MATFLAPPPRRVELPNPKGGVDVIYLHYKPALTSGVAMARGRAAAEKALGRPLPQDDDLVELYTQGEMLAEVTMKEDGTPFYLNATDALSRAGQDTLTFLSLEYDRLRADASPFKTGLAASDFERLLVEMGVAPEGARAIPFWNRLAPDLQWTCVHTMARLLLASRIDSYSFGSPDAPGGVSE